MFLEMAGWQAGEISSAYEGRSDLAALKYGCRLARNVIPTRSGGMLQRSGLMTRGLAREQTANRVCMIPFVASADVAYKIEAGAGYFRFWTNGSLVTTTAAAIGRPGVVSLLGTPLVLATPYAAGVLFELQYAHANDVMWITHENSPTQKLIRFAVDGFYIESMAFVFPPLRDQNSEEITLTVTGTLTTGGIVALVAAGGDVFTAGDVGGYYGIDHRRANPFVEITLSAGSGTASSVLLFSGNAIAGQTVTIGTGVNLRVYTWMATAEGAYSVPVGGTQAISLTSLALAINGGVGVSPGTIAHPSVTADDLGSFASPASAMGTLTCTDNALESGSPDKVITGSGANKRTYRFRLVINGSSPAYDVLIGASITASLLNLAKAMNATGVAGTDYGPGTLVNPDVSANPVIIGNALVVTALVAGAAGNTIVTDVDDTSRLSWRSPTLTGGADAATNKMQVTARIEGAGTLLAGTGNFIAVAETMTDGVWQPADFLAGGADNTSFNPANPSAVIPTVRVNGMWEVYTLGRWYGTLTLQQQRATGEWETVRTWDSQNDKNVQATGTVSGEKLMRLTFVGSGIADDDAPARAVLTATDTVVHGLVLITAVADSMHATGTVVRDIWSTDPTYLWSGGSFSDRRGYPSAVVIHQQRLVFGIGSRVIGSQTGGFDNFEKSELADSSYQEELAATSVANIVSMQSQAGLTILTEDSEWLMDGGSDGGVIRPDQPIRTQQLTRYGSARATSQIIGSNIIFIQAGRFILNEYLFQFNNQDFTAVDLAELADHLSVEGIKQIAYARVPHSLILVVTAEGSLLSLAYRRSAGGADQGGQLAWSKHETPHGVIESVCVVPSAIETSDVWFVVRRELPGSVFVRTIESFDTLYWDNCRRNIPATITDICVLDGSKKFTGLLPADPVLTGLDHLDGLVVDILLNGYAHPQRVVVGGAVTLDMSDAPVIGTSTAIVGLAPRVEIQPWFASLQLKDGGSDGRSFKVAKFNVRFYQCGAATYADDNTGSPFHEVHFRRGSDAIDEPVPLFTGLLKLDNAGSYRNESSFIFVNESPLPMNIAGLTAEISVHG